MMQLNGSAIKVKETSLLPFASRATLRFFHLDFFCFGDCFFEGSRNPFQKHFAASTIYLTVRMLLFIPKPNQ
jgi:hypothetical protein